MLLQLRLANLVTRRRRRTTTSLLVVTRPHVSKLSWQTIARGLRSAKRSIFTRSNLKMFMHRGRRLQSMDMILNMLEYGYN